MPGSGEVGSLSRGGGLSSLLSLLWMLICVLVIIALAYFFTKYVVGRSKLGMTFSEKQNIIKVMTRLSIGKDGQLLLVQVGEKYFLLGNTAAGITNLAEFTPEEAEAWKSKEDPPGGDQPPSFREALGKAWKQRIKR